MTDPAVRGPAVYLAGPDVFLPDAREVGREKVAICARHGLRGRFPLDTPLPDAPATGGPTAAREEARAISRSCRQMMDDCVAGLANLTPFRGVGADVGTAFEVGYLTARGAPVLGYTSERRDHGDRVEPDGMEVERFGLADNLMVAVASLDAGSEVIRVPGGGVAAMAAFEEAVGRLARILGARPDGG